MEGSFSGRRVLLSLALWACFGGVAVGATVLAFRLVLPSWTAAHRPSAGVVVVVELYLGLLAALVVAAGGPQGVRDRLGFRFSSRGDLFLALAAWLAALFAGGAVSALLEPVTGRPTSNAVAVLRLSHEFLFVALVVPTTCLLAPAAEELLFRGALFGWLRGHLSLWPSAVLTAALFAGVHLLPLLFPFLFLFGVFAAYVRERTGSTLNTFAMHAGQNTLAVVFAYSVLSQRPPAG